VFKHQTPNEILVEYGERRNERGDISGSALGFMIFIMAAACVSIAVNPAQRHGEHMVKTLSRQSTEIQLDINVKRQGHCL
jgi:hypothetical protein